ncbi:glycosyltransferase [Massilia sp. W12]|uniref:glycosyltransferase n=1 Tax=Massilia sp. W12 TaxID=3126507 RepID=UPI0030CB48E5
MRLLFDLQACQLSDAAELQHIIALLQALQQNAAAQDWQCCALLNQGLPNWVQKAMRDSALNLPFFSFELPPARDNAEYNALAAQIVRDDVIRQSDADLIYQFWRADHAPQAQLPSRHAQSGMPPRVLHILQTLPAELGTEDGAHHRHQPDWHFQTLPWLSQAAALVCGNAQDAAYLRKALPHSRVLSLAPPCLPQTLSGIQDAPPRQAPASPHLLLFAAGAKPQQQRMLWSGVCQQLARHPDWQAVLAGAADAQEQQRLSEIASRSGCAGQLQFASPHSAQEWQALFAQSTLGVLCTAAPVQAGLHAALCGLPLAVSSQHALSLWPEFCQFQELPDRICTDLNERLAQLLQTACAPPAPDRLQQNGLPALLEALRQIIQTPAPLHAPRRPRLAFVSPLPPLPSGIADYSAELIPELARDFALELIVAQPELKLPWGRDLLPLRDLAWFEAHADSFDHILYHLGNSPMHSHMFSLLQRHPGVVVLHDFYLANVLDYMHHQHITPHAFMRELYESHGYSALLEQSKIGVVPSIWAYPCNKRVLDAAHGVIAHAAFPARLAQRWYGADYGRDWQVLPLLRGRADLPDADLPQARSAARATLGLQEEDYVVCSFGMLGRTKHNLLLLQAFVASALASAAQCHLVFVGANEGGEYGRSMLEQIQAAGLGARIRITGFVDAAAYRQWLLAADCAVQLRIDSRGETSAAVLDCLLYGAPTIVNAHGSLAELPSHTVRQLPDLCTAEDLRDALENLWRNPAARAELRQAGLAHIASQHAPGIVGQAYRQALEHFANHGKQQRRRGLLHSIAHLAQEFPQEIEAGALINLAQSLADNQAASAPRRLLVDLSAMVQTDLKTGIQRVVRSILLALLADCPPGWRIEPVYSEGRNQPYRHAHRYMQQWLGHDSLGLDDAPVQSLAGDIFLGLDLFMHGSTQNEPQLQAMRRRGVQIVFVVYDILPLLLPDRFPSGAAEDFGAWLQMAGRNSDALLCISRAVADEVHAWFTHTPPKRAPQDAPLQLGWFHLGADLDASAPSQGLPENAAALLAQIQARPAFLMVGTVEPRKGHAMALQAFELLWARGVDVNLVIVGKQGWMVDALCQRLQTHAELGRRLFWLQGMSDEMLGKVYAASKVLLANSEGEGFGLPLIEAAQHGLPVLARNLPVFVEVMTEHAQFFQGGASELAQAAQDWLALDAAGAAPQSNAMRWLNWRESAQQLRQALLEGAWYRSWQAPQ